jgi:glucosamine--fructose-6-phosphate aminotransferase (isomerizing)
LKKLEYRGYDSAGISISQAGTLQVIKTRGRLAALEQKLEGMSLEATCGIGHTRWATHGEPNDVNSHPHLSANGRISLVHNGIIENYAMIKTFLEDKGVRFVSETDTEVIAQLLEYHYREEPDLMAAFLLTLNELEGAYALGVMCADQPDEFLAARKDSPRFVGLGEGENFIASDIPAILAHTREILIIEDREVVRVTRDGVTLFNLLGEAVSREPFHVDWDVAAAEKGGYEHFMMKEICEEPATVRATLAPRIREGKVDAGLAPCRRNGCGRWIKSMSLPAAPPITRAWSANRPLSGWPEFRWKSMSPRSSATRIRWCPIPIWPLWSASRAKPLIR